MWWGEVRISSWWQVQHRQAWVEHRQEQERGMARVHAWVQHDCSQSSVLHVPRIHHATSAEIFGLPHWYIISCSHLGFECVVFLWEILLSVMVWVSSSVSPLECVRCWDIDVLEIVFSTISTISSWLGEGNTMSSWTIWPWVCWHCCH